MYDNRKVEREEEQKQMVCKILMILYANISFIKKKKRLQTVDKSDRDSVISVISQACKCLSNAESTVTPNDGLNVILSYGGFVFN